MKYPIFTRGRLMVTGKDRVEVDGVNVPVSISDVQVKPGDIVVCDDTGVVVIPLGKAEEILDVATKIDEAEQKILELLEKGMALREARKQMNYHKLQTRK